jgi:hypothetical protein
VPNVNTDSPCISSADLSDAMFCLYRMNVLKRNPNPDHAAMAAVASRMKRLARSYPEGLAAPGNQRVYSWKGPQ